MKVKKLYSFYNTYAEKRLYSYAHSKKQAKQNFGKQMKVMHPDDIVYVSLDKIRLEK